MEKIKKDDMKRTEIVSMKGVITRSSDIKVFTLSFVLFIFCLSCSSTTKEDSGEVAGETWVVTVSGKVGFPQQGQILIQEIKNGGAGWQDTVALKKDYTYSKRIKLSQPGYYKITFFNRQYVDFILYKSNIEINVDGNDPSGFAEIKGSPEIDIIRKTQAIMRDIESSPASKKPCANVGTPSCLHEGSHKRSGTGCNNVGKRAAFSWRCKSSAKQGD